MPLLDLFWTMMLFFLFVAWIWLLIVVLSDVFRSRDLSGWAKALWTLFVLFLPWLGAFIYLLIRGGEMSERAAQAEADRLDRGREYAAISTPGGASSTGRPSPATEIDRLASLRDSGVLTEDEFQARKAKLLAQA
ncbi:MAG TPA: SHOCT domain-containing protein [Actinomycetes bacterium]|nr:SHOCT domain-containing protein [Actinomycetes bacterium]